MDQPTLAVDSPFAPRKSRPMLPAAEAQSRLVESTIELLRNNPVSAVTVRKIAIASGLHATTISRNFGSMGGLLSHICALLSLRSIELMTAIRDVTIFDDPDFLLRTKLLAGLIAEGADPASFRIDWERGRPKQILSNFLTEAEGAGGPVGARAAASWVQIAIFMLEGFVLFREVHGLDEAMFRDQYLLFEAFTNALPELQETLGWDAG